MRAIAVRLSGWRGRFVLVAALAAGATGVSASAAVAAPKWGITMTHLNPYGLQAGECLPNHKAEPMATPPCGVDPFTEKEAGDKGEAFPRESAGDTYQITVTNHGVGETTLEPVHVKDKLPKGIAFVETSVVQALEPPAASGKGWRCTGTADAVSVDCVRETPEKLPEGVSYPPITLRVAVNPPALNPSINRPSVEGGGAVTTTLDEQGDLEPTAKEESEVQVTGAVPFGIASITTSAFKEPSNPLTEPLSEAFTQAGGHIFAYTSEEVFNYTTAPTTAPGPPALGGVVTAGGGPKSIQVEVPPGFVGNPQNIPRCPLKSLLSIEPCPAASAVGEIELHVGVGRLEKGQGKPATATVKKSFIFSMQPAPGHPASFGFIVAYEPALIPIILEASVRSDGDYGVTVGNRAGGTGILVADVTAVKTMFCENGMASPGRCKPASAGSKPFLSNPTQCSGPPPATTVQASPWAEPTDEVSKTGYIGAHLSAGAPSATESFITGCDQLRFQPEVEFKPSAPEYKPGSTVNEGGTSEADEPTGMTLNLKLPQTNDPTTKATPELKNSVMTLPAGLTASPSAAAGLQACSDAQFGLETEFGPGPEARKKRLEEQTGHSVPETPAKPASCPPASQIGTVEVFTPLLSGAPAIEGWATDGQELTCTQGTWGGDPTSFAYQWLLSGVPIAGATGNEFRVPEGKLDDGQAIQCRVTATNANGSAVVVSRDAVISLEPAVLPPFPPSSLAAPKPSGTPSPGTASVGETLTCASESNAWTGSPSFTYRWLRDGTAISGAEGETYVLAHEDEGKVIQCQLTASNQVAKNGGTVLADSAAVVVGPPPSAAPPLPGAALQGQAFQGEPECSPCSAQDAEEGKLLPLFIQAQDARAGVVVKLHGKTEANRETGQLTSVFENQPQQPFELFQLKLKGGPRAPLANPQSCGLVTTTADLTPWSAPGLGGLSGTEPIAGTADGTPSSSFSVGGCPASSPFSPSFNAGTTGANATVADQSPSFSLTFSRQDREQDLSGIQVHMPPGLVGKIAGIPRCGEAQANAGTCGPESQIGTTEAGAGPGPTPFFQTGRVYLTGPYKGAPFGLSVVTPAVAGPFNLGIVVVRTAISIDPNTAAVTATSDPLPKIIDGVPLRLRTINVNLNRPGFMLNPTNCSAQQISATLSSTQGASTQVSSPFGLAGCTSLPFKPVFTASTAAHTSKTEGASLNVKITYPQGAYANIAKTVTELPNALPSRLTTIQKACVDTVFESNPALCPEGSVIGNATAHTPLLSAPLTGPAYLISHGNRAFPDIEIVLQGEGVEVILDGHTDIKKGITKTSFEAIPDSPVSTFELNLPEGPHSALAANVNLCENQSALNLPTILTGQNGAVIKQNTKIVVTGCPPTVAITKTTVAGNALLVTIKTTAKGRVKIVGKGLKTVSKNLNAGTYRIRVALTKTGRSMRKHHKKVAVRISLTVGKQVAAKATSVRL